MKKALILSLMISLIVLALVSCGGNEGNGGEQTHTHSFGEWETVEPATCVDKGEKVRYCDCGEMQTGVISATGEHNEVVDKAVAPTCTEAGLTEGKHCAFCNLVIVAQTPVDATGHTEVVDVAVPATCTEAGLTEGKHCSVCKEVLVKQGVEPIVAHTYDDKYDESCNICGGTRDAECAHTTTEPIPGYAATCTEPGLTDGQKCKKCGEVLIYQTSIDAKGHTEVTLAAVAATCTKTGLTEGKNCSACDTVLIKQSVVPTLPHAYGDWVVTKTANCGQDGEMTRYCSCGDMQTQVIYGNGAHTEIIDYAVEPTCTTTGLTEGKHCAYCGTVLAQQTVVPMLEHSYNTEYSFDYDYHWYACKNCNSKKDSENHRIAANGICTVCNQPVGSTEGVIYIKSLDGTYAEVIGYNGTEPTVVIANTYEGVPVKSIYAEAFYQNKVVKSLIISDSVVSIGEKAFYNCINLTSVEMGDGVIAIGDEAFKYCYYLESVEIGKSVQTIGASAFYDCDKLISVVIPDGVKTIGSYAFYECSRLDSIVIGNGVTSIGTYAFNGCTLLTSVVMGDSVEYIGNCAFYECSQLTSIEIPSSVTFIGTSAFSACDKLKYNTYNSCNYLGNESNPYHALISVQNKKSSTYTIHGYTKVIASSAFESCTSLKSIEIPDGVVSIGYSAFYKCSALTSIVIPEGVTSIGSNAFNSCSSLTSVVIPDSVTSIGGSAFSDCSKLTSVVIPNSVTYIGASAFWGCSKLKTVYYTGSEEEWAKITIGSDNYYLTGATIHYNYVPEE